MSDPNYLQAAGDITIESIVITTAKGFYQDITNQVSGLSIYEDIFSPFITGDITIKDALDLLNVFPLIGEEFLHLKLKTPTLNHGNIDAKFYITKMRDRQPTGDRGYLYQLQFISEEALIDVNKKISKSFGGRCSDIAKQVLMDSQHGFQLKNVSIEPTSNRTKYTSNFWSPVKNMNALCDTSINENGSASYVFYQDRYGYNFVSLESLCKTEVYQEFVYDNYIRDVKEDGKSSKNVTETFKRIKDVKIPVAYDYIDRSTNGMYGSKLYTYDIITKKYNNINYDMMQNFKNQYHLNKFPIISSKSTYRYNSMIIAMTKDSDSYSGFGDVTNASSIQNRVSLMTQLNAHKLEIIVPGRLDYTVGLRVNLIFYKNQPTEEKDTQIIDEMFSGSYLISAINHFISRSSHECTIEVIKDSLIRDLDKV